MTVPYSITWTATAKRSLQHLPEKVAAAAVEFIYRSLADNPQRVDKALRFELEGLHSARRGDYRIIYLIDETIVVVAIEHRADAYGS